MLEGIAAVAQAGWPGLKLDTVVMRGVNDDELADLIEYGAPGAAEVRFIEYMDVGGATHWSHGPGGLARARCSSASAARYGPIEPIVEESSAPADRFRLPDGTRLRDHLLHHRALLPRLRPEPPHRRRPVVSLPLRAARGTDLREPLRAGASREELLALIRSTWQGRRDRGRRGAAGRRRTGSPLIQIGELKRDPHLEMHTRGG